MQFLFCFILLSNIFVDYSFALNDTDFIQCTSRCQRVTVAFSAPLLFPDDCQENNGNLNNNYDYALVCGIEYSVNYDTQQVHIDFFASNDTGSLEDQKDGDFLVQTIRASLSQTSNQPTIVNRRYGCNTGNDCARKSYVDSIDYLVNQGQTQINTLKSKLQNDSLIIGHESRRRCIDSHKNGSKPSVKCSYGLCHVRLDDYQSDEQEDRKVQGCVGNDHPTFFSEIEQHTPASSEKGREVLEYKCNKNVCNRDDFVKRVRDLIGEFTNANSKVAEIVNEKMSGSFSTRQTISSITLVLFLSLFQALIFS